jgi:pSer/pThr/pTyr-binding forkhead associated (FHA) protein
MSRLILSLDDQILAEYNMTKERYTIGRLPDNDVRIDNPAVSGHHSLIINILNDSFLEDLNSTNGTYVNGKLIKKHALQHGDVITIGHHQLRFSDQTVSDAEQDEFEKTMVIPASEQQRRRVAAEFAATNTNVSSTQTNVDTGVRDYIDTGVRPRMDSGFRSHTDTGVRTHADTGMHSQVDTGVRTHADTGMHSQVDTGVRTHADTNLGMNPPPQPKIPPAAKLQVLSGTFAGRELELKKALTTLGRPGVQVAAVTRRADGYYIIHVESKIPGNYPLVNGQPIGAHAYKLEDNDVVQLAGVKMGFFTS